MSKKISYILIILGGLVAFYAQAEKQQNEYLLIGGIVLLMLGLYRLARTIPSRSSDSSDGDESSESN